MARNRNKLELHGESQISGNGVLVIANRLSFGDVLHLESQFGERQIVYLTERGLDYDPLLQSHFEKTEVEAVEFSLDEASKANFKKELHQFVLD